jgi:hypothetical protein
MTYSVQNFCNDPRITTVPPTVTYSYFIIIVLTDTLRRFDRNTFDVIRTYLCLNQCSYITNKSDFLNWFYCKLSKCYHKSILHVRSRQLHMVTKFVPSHITTRRDTKYYFVHPFSERAAATLRQKMLTYSLS